MVESKSMKVHRERLVLFSAGAVVAAAAFILVLLGNPGNMGFCIACFLRDIAGSLGLHSSATTQYLRPEIPGLVLGAFIVALARGEFRPTSGSSPVIRFIIAACVSIGALVFLGCPLRMVLRLAAGDLNALFGLAGLICGVGIGTIFFRQGFSLGRSQKQSTVAGLALPLVLLGLLALALTHQPIAGQPSNGSVFTSVSGPGSAHAPLLISLAAGLAVGFMAQRSRFCTMGAIRDVILFRQWHLALGLLAMLGMALALNAVFGGFKPGFTGQPIAHTESLWNFLGMVTAGLAFALAGGCPGRQLFMAGEGDNDAAIFVAGLLIGAAFAHNFGMASSGAGIGPNGAAAAIGGLVICLIIGVFNCKRGA